MPKIVLGKHPDPLEVRLVHGDGKALAATLVDATGQAIDWPEQPTLEFAAASDRDTVLLAKTAQTDGPVASWTLTSTDVDELHAASRGGWGTPTTVARLTLPDQGNGEVAYAGEVAWSDGWTAGDSAQRVTFTLPGGPPGPKGDKGDPGDGGTSSLLVINGGSVELDDQLPDGYLVGYKVTAPTSIAGREFAAGTYIFERDFGVFGGWTVRSVTPGDAVVAPPDETAPAAGVLASTAVTETTFTLTVTGASDETALAAAPYAFSTDGGATWSAYQASAACDVTGKAAATAYQCRHRVKDAAGNVSTGATITVTTPSADPAAGWSVFDAFTAADGTALNGRNTTKGGKSWSSFGRGLTMGGAAEGATITGNAVVNGYMPGIQTHEADLDLGSADAEVSVDYDLTAGTAAIAERQVLVALAAGTGDSDTLAVRVRGDGVMQLYKGGVAPVALAGVTSGHPASGTLVVKRVGTAFTATTAAGTATAALATGAGWSGTGTRVAFGVREDGSKVDNFKARTPA